MNNAMILYDGDEEEGQGENTSLTEFASQTSDRRIDPISDKLNVALQIAAMFSGKRAPLSDFENEAVNDLERDLFWVMYQYEFDLKPEPPTDRELTRMMLEFVLLDPLFDARRFNLIGRLISSSAAAYTLTDELLKDPEFGSAMGAMGQADQKEKEADDLENPQPQPNWDDGWGDQDEEQDEDAWGGEEDENEGQGSGSNVDNLTDQERQEQAQDLRQQAKDLREKAKQKVEDFMQGTFSEMIRSGAVSHGMKTADQVGNFLSSWGLEEGEGLELSLAEIRELMKLMTIPGLSSLTSLMGRVYGVSIATIHGRSPAQVIVEQGGNTRILHDIHRSDLPFLSSRAPKSVRADYVKRYLQSGLPGRARTSQAKSEGAYLWAVDGSSSMESGVPVDKDGDVHVSRHVVAKALTLGMARAAKDNGQKYSVFSFGAGHEVSEVVTQSSSLSELIRFATFDFNGGTDFDLAMNTMMDLFEALDDEDKLQADMGITTDGEGGLDQPTIDRLLYLKERWKCRLHMLLIGDASNEALEPLADNVLQFTSLDNVAQILSIAVWQ